MFGRPRCREWTPLSTQQLRLRSLVQIVGYNIRPPEWCTSPCSFYLTLHNTTMSAPFYTSERICSPHPKWKEIDSEILHHMSSTNVIIRIWCHIYNNKDSNAAQDTIIQTWGVYFSGLRYIGANLASYFTSDCFKSNTLVFQMHGGYFCSYKSLKLDVIPAENEKENGSLSSNSSGRTNTSKLEPKFIQNHKFVKEPRSISPNKHSKAFDREYSKSQSPVERGIHQNFPTLRTSSSLNIGQTQDGREENTKSKNFYEQYPDQFEVQEFRSNDVICDSLPKNASQEELSASKIDLSETAESYDLRNELDGTPKLRYLALNFLKSEIRPSYTATKLQKLHLLQYSIMKRKQAVQEIKERIYKNSAVTNGNWSRSDDFDDRLAFKSRSQRNLFSPDDSNNLDKDKSTSQIESTDKNGRIKGESRVSNGPRLTLKLNDLLSFKSKPSPLQRAEHVRLTKQIEILRFKRIILSDERDSKLTEIRRLKEKRSKLFEENQDVGSELMQNYHSLSRRNEIIKETRQSCAALRELAARSHASLATLRCELLHQLHQIFYIQQKEIIWTICDIPLPISSDENPRVLNPLSDSVAAGYVAQVTCLSAAILNHPLRYKITLLGSASKILDDTPDLPDPNIPLFVRSGDVTLFRYGMFLLNKCVAQLLYGRGLAVSDIRPTLGNLQRLLEAPCNLSDTAKLFGTYRRPEDSSARTQSLRSLVATERKYRPFNRFKDSVDGQSPQSAMNLRMHRLSKSVGSYIDDQELPALDASTTSIMGSEPNIYNTKLAQTNSDQLLKAHNSDPQLQRLADTIDPDKVVFTLGDDSNLTNLECEPKLVRISSNNDDEITCPSCLDDNVKRICTEIEDFCSVNDSHETLLEERLNITEYMVRKASSDGDSSECAKSVMEVIVIPSAEAVLDTGQSHSE